MRRRIVLIFLAILCQLSAYATDINDGDIDVSQLFILQAYPGGNEQHFSVLENQVRKNNPGGLLIRNGNPVQIARLVDRMNKKAKNPLLVGGSLQMSGLSLPSSNVMKNVVDINVLRETGILIGERLDKIGIDFVLDPSLDPGNDEFRYGKYFAQGYYTEGILPVYSSASDKDFLGDGGVIVQYQAPILVSRRKTDYSKTEAFKLRASGFDGLIIISMSSKDLEDELAVLHAFKSGADMLIYPEDPGKAISRMKRSIKSGEISEKEIEEKYLRIARYKFPSPQPYSDKIKYLASEKDSYIFQKLHRSSVALVRNQNSLLPFGMLDTLEVAIFTSPKFAVFNNYVSKYGYVFDASKFDPILLQSFESVIVPATPETDLNWLRNMPDKSKFIVAAFGFENLSDLSTFENVIISPELNEITQRFVPQIIYGAEVPLGSWAGKLPSGFHASIDFEPLNRLSYDHPLAAGSDPDILNQISKVALEAINEGATPGLQVLVARRGKVIFQGSYGYQTYEQKVPVTDQTIYDLASVTKVLATLQSVMFMQERNLIDIDTPLSHYLPELKGSNKEDLVIKDILLHQAGLRPWLPFWRQTMDHDDLSGDFYSKYPEESYPLQVSEGLYAISAIRDSVWNWIIDSRLMRKKDDEPYGYRYSDMGFYMMQRLAESRLNQPLNEFVAQNFYDPLGMVTTTYLPLCKFEPSRIAPTAEDMYFRKGLINGLVHDEGAAMFGGVAGHSGLFSNANDLAKILQMLLQGGEYGGSRYFDSETIELFSRKQVMDNRRGLGWDKPNVGQWRSPTSVHASAETFGHTGFTGTAVWVDPAYDLVYVFLSNRINPDAENDKLMKLNIRSRIQEIIYKSIWQMDQYNETVSPEP